MRDDKTLMEMYEQGRQHEMTEGERSRLHDLPEFKAQASAARRPDDEQGEVQLKSPHDVVAIRRADEAAHEWPYDVLHPQGLVGEVNDWVLSSSAQPQPKFALAAALTVCGALLGRGVKDYTGQQTNIFSLCLGASSVGKDHPFRMGKKIVTELRRDKLLAAEVTSDSALEILLDAFPSRLMFLDEVGDYLGSIKTAGQSNPYLRTVVPCLKKLWSSAQSEYVGKTRAADSNGKWHEPKKIQMPHVAIYGTGAPSRLFECMTERDFDDGSIPRFISFISEVMPKRIEKPEPIVPDELIKKLNDALLMLDVKRPDIEGVKVLRPIPEAKEASDAFADFEQFKFFKMQEASDDPPLYLWGKSVENARRIALTVACFRNPASPIVERQDAEYAISLMKCSISEMIGYVRENVAASERERNVKKIERIIRRASVNGITHSELTRKTQGMKDRDDAIDDLVDGQTIVCEYRQGTGKKKVRWYWHKRYVEQTA